MKKTVRRTAAMLAGVAVISTISACSSDRLTAPVQPEPQAGLIGSVLDLATSLLTPVKGLLRLQPIGEVRRSITVGTNGGVLDIPETGLRLTIPRGAVTSTTTITVKSIAGNMVAYDFEPHGIKFAVPIQFSQDLSKTGLTSTAVLTGGYFKSVDQLKPDLGLALIDEELPARIVGSRVVFDIRHFSGYLMSTGRASKTEAAALQD